MAKPVSECDGKSRSGDGSSSEHLCPRREAHENYRTTEIMTDGSASSTPNDPHAGQPIKTRGVPLDAAEGAILLIHGRGARAAGMLQLAKEIDPTGLALLAPQARRGVWYPDRFMAPIEHNQPALNSARACIERAVTKIRAAGIDNSSLILAGFSQGACLTADYAMRNPAAYGGIVLLSGGLIGEPTAEFTAEGSLEGTQTMLGVSDDDPHIPVKRAETTVDIFRTMNADVRFDLYEGRGHDVFPEELSFLAERCAAVTASQR